MADVRGLLTTAQQLPEASKAALPVDNLSGRAHQEILGHDIDRSSCPEEIFKVFRRWRSFTAITTALLLLLRARGRKIDGMFVVATGAIRSNAPVGPIFRGREGEGTEG